MMNRAIDWESGVVNLAKSLLDDIGPCRMAGYRIQWLDCPSTVGRKVPALVLCFDAQAIGPLVPACAIRLTSFPGNREILGDNLRRHIREGVEQFLMKNGLWAPTPFGQTHVKVNA